MNTFSNQVSRISRFSRAKVAIAAAAIALTAAFAPASPAAAAAPASAPSQFVASIYLGPLTIPMMRHQCKVSWNTISIYKVGLNWRCNRPVGVDPVVNYSLACKLGYNKPTAFAGAPNAFGARRCFKPLPLVANP